MKVGIFSNYKFNYETMEVNGNGVYRHQLELGSKRGETTDRDLFAFMKDLMYFHKRVKRIDNGVGRDIFESITRIYGSLGVCSSFKLDSFTKDLKDDGKIYYVDTEKIDIEYLKREIVAFNAAFTFFEQKVGFSKTEPTLADKRTFIELLEPAKKHITFDMQLDNAGKPTKRMRPNNMLGVAYTELENLFFRNSKIKECDFYACGKTYTSNKPDNKCCSSKCAAAYRRDKKRFVDAHKEGKQKTIQRLREEYADRVINEWTEFI